MSLTVEEGLTVLQRALWIVDNARVRTYPQVGDDGALVDPVGDDQGRPVADVLEEWVRPSKRGVQRRGLTVRLWLALLIVA